MAVVLSLLRDSGELSLIIFIEKVTHVPNYSVAFISATR